MTPKLKLVTTKGQTTVSHQPLSMAVGIPDKKYIPAGAIVTSHLDVENLPSIAQSNHHQINARQKVKHRLLTLVA